MLDTVDKATMRNQESPYCHKCDLDMVEDLAIAAAMDADSDSESDGEQESGEESGEEEVFRVSNIFYYSLESITFN